MRSSELGDCENALLLMAERVASSMSPCPPAVSVRNLETQENEGEWGEIERFRRQFDRTAPSGCDNGEMAFAQRCHLYMQPGPSATRLCSA
jgi:hypothetical protein